MLHQLAIVFVLPHIGLERFHSRAVFPGLLFQLLRVFLRGVVAEHNIGTRLREHLHRRRANSPRPPGDERRLACQ